MSKHKPLRLYALFLKFSVRRSPKMVSSNQRSQQTKRLKLSVDPTLTLLTLVKTATAHHLSRKMMHFHE
ncbi:hypothetical protein [Nostoc sp.]|uniref:hypothetical protein n=1 Tax=Nostoc sp. TaxID=1180 RepID=UPI002FFC04B7